MSGEPDIAQVAKLLGDPSSTLPPEACRSAILLRDLRTLHPAAGKRTSATGPEQRIAGSPAA